jgi:hypothetical protein
MMVVHALGEQMNGRRDIETARERWRWLMRRDLPNEEWRSAISREN